MPNNFGILWVWRPLLHLFAPGFNSKQDENRTQYEPSQHKGETKLVSIETVLLNTVNPVTLPVKIQNEPDGRLKNHGAKHYPHIADA